MATGSRPLAHVPASRPARADAADERPGRRRRRRWPRLSLASRFLLANLAILLVAGVVVGVWVGDQLERSIIDRTASVTSLFVESIIEPSVASMADGAELTPEEIATLDAHLTASALSERVRSLRLWADDGRIAYSPDAELIGTTFPVGDHLAAAWDGSVTTEMNDLSGAGNAWERARWSRLLGIYIPVRERGSERIIAVAEFYLPPREIDAEVGEARRTTWLLVTLAIVVAGLLLWGIVKRGSDTIERQELELSRQVGELSGLLAQNAELGRRVHLAAERTTTLNERSMRRVSSDLHDGPGQMLSLALLRLDRLQERAGRGDPPSAEEIAEVEAVLEEALADMRGVAAGLRLPELAPMSAAEVAGRATQEHERRSGTPVRLTVAGVPDDVPLSVRIGLYRALQESLSNATRHGGSAAIDVELRGGVGADRRAIPGLWLIVRDDGRGFDPAAAAASDGLGLAGIREGAEVLGGTFEVRSAPGRGTELRVWWPLASGMAGPAADAWAGRST